MTVIASMRLYKTKENSEIPHLANLSVVILQKNDAAALYFGISASCKNCRTKNSFETLKFVHRREISDIE